ncbi:unnamed protein product (macronuclear) [Paramecium tetraurelia]|uniref:Uncharacterized protein n=1 Tax=Paramecium tetraurelia TaxID=5888 RepID=A0CP52_PARTE|nr:uncharacterized protein GSPATT00008960001 [Paramecium tetraurelia]CAK72569.1 unnamed protein product [Paramecium tetraurelia]|eukprot:XP_001439966.1 hypothetical protein (macronuclear) [Paramecium tetraurelia strain d4-2]
MQRSSNSPIFLSPDQFATLFNQGIRESLYLDEMQDQRELSFSAPKTDETNQSNLPIQSSNFLPEFPKDDVVISIIHSSLCLVSKQIYEQSQNIEQHNKQLSESYQRILKQNKELLNKRKELEEENQGLLEENFDLKRQAHELQQKLTLAQNQMLAKRDQEIQTLKQQIKELQCQSNSRDSATKTEGSTATSHKYCFGSNTHRVQSNEQSKNPSRFTSPVPKQQTSEFSVFNQYNSNTVFGKQPQL